MKKPLVFYTVSVFFGCFTVLICVNNLLLGAATAASFLAISYFTINKKYIILIFIFFILGIIDYTYYFNPKIDADSYADIRIIKKDNLNTDGIYNGRKLRLSGNLNKLRVGDKIYGKGVFTKAPDYEKGIVGTYKLTDIKLGKEDYYYRLQEFKKKIYTKFSEGLGEKRAAVLVAACFGDVSYLQNDQKSELSLLGIVHIVSVSGLHMALVYKALELIAGYQFGILVSLIYVIFTGAQASTVRSFIMILVLKLSKKFYKKYDNLSSLALSALALLIWKPYYISDLGFMLSYLSVLGIIIFYDRVRRILYYLPQYLNEGISLTLSAQSFSTPYAIFYFKTFGSGFILGNIFLLPLYSLLVILGNAALIFMNLEYIFKMINYIINNIMIAIEGGTYLLLKICPPILYFSYAETAALLILYILYMVRSNLKRNFLYLPLCILLIGFYDNFKLFPEIQYMKIYNTTGILIKYKGDSILFMQKMPSAFKDMSKAKVTYRVNDIRLIPPQDTIIKVGDETSVKIINSQDTKSKRNIKLEVVTPNRSTIVTFEGVIEDSPNSINYDIIYLKNDSGKKSYETNKRLALLRIFFNRVYVIS